MVGLILVSQQLGKEVFDAESSTSKGDCWNVGDERSGVSARGPVGCSSACWSGIPECPIVGIEVSIVLPKVAKLQPRANGFGCFE